jgi:hypothetical protein
MYNLIETLGHYNLNVPYESLTQHETAETGPGLKQVAHGLGTLIEYLDYDSIYGLTRYYRHGSPPHIHY